MSCFLTSQVSFQELLNKLCFHVIPVGPWYLVIFNILLNNTMRMGFDATPVLGKEPTIKFHSRLHDS